MKQHITIVIQFTKRRNIVAHKKTGVVRNAGQRRFIFDLLVSRNRLNELQRPVTGENRSLRDDNDLVADHVLLDDFRFGCILDPLRIDNSHVFADRTILVDNRALDMRTGTDSQRRQAVGRVGRNVLIVFEIIVAHQNRIANNGVLSDNATITNDAILDHRTFFDDAAVGNQTGRYLRPVDARGWQKSSTRVDRSLGNIKRKSRTGRRQFQIRVEERFDRTDIFPVAVEQVKLHVHIRTNRSRKYTATEIGMRRLFKTFDKRVATEEINPHARQTVTAARVNTVRVDPAGLGSNRRELFLACRLFDKSLNASRIVDPHDAQTGCFARMNGQTSDRHFGFRFDVRFEHLPEIHPIELVARKDEDIVDTRLLQVTKVLTNRIGRALIPVVVFDRLLRGKDFDKSVIEAVESVTPSDVLVQADRIELSNNVNLIKAAIDAVRKRNVDQAVLTSDRNGRLRPNLGQRK